MAAEYSEWRQELLQEVQLPAQLACFQLPWILSRQDVAKILACPPYSLVWRVLYGSGVRPHELFAIEFSDSGQLQVAGRTVCLDPPTLAELKANPISGDPDQLLSWWREAAANTGLDRKFAAANRTLHPQTLRHTFASHRLEDGMDLITLYYQLGHRLILTTRMYTRTALKSVGDEYRRSHPLCLPAAVRTPQARLTIPDVLAMLEAHPKLLARLILRTFYAAGLRLAELLALRRADLTPAEHRLFVRCGKNSVDRYVLIDGETARRLCLHGQTKNPDQPLFDPVAERTLRYWVRSAAQAVGILEKYEAAGYTISPHGLRHAFASHCYQQGMTLHCVAQLLGHSWLQDTLVYADCPLDFRQGVYARTHPLA